MKRTLVKFLRNAIPYAKDEIAGFTAQLAERYVANKIAVYCDKDGKTVATPVEVSVRSPRAQQILAGADKAAA